MGLKVTGYSKCTLLEACSLDLERGRCGKLQSQFDGSDGTTCVYVAGFPERMADLAEGFYRYESCHGFSAGSYSGYNEWREDLAAVVGTTPERVWAAAKAGDPPTAIPFYELINFSDCDGGFGPAVCAKLRDDFERERQRAIAWAEEHLDGHEKAWFALKYEDFAKAFTLGADGGLVKFH